MLFSDLNELISGKKFSNFLLWDSFCRLCSLLRYSIEFFILHFIKSLSDVNKYCKTVLLILIAVTIQTICSLVQVTIYIVYIRYISPTLNQIYFLSAICYWGLIIPRGTAAMGKSKNWATNYVFEASTHDLVLGGFLNNKFLKFLCKKFFTMFSFSSLPNCIQNYVFCLYYKYYLPQLSHFL